MYVRLSVCYHPPKKLPEGNVYSRVSVSLFTAKVEVYIHVIITLDTIS